MTRILELSEATKNSLCLYLKEGYAPGGAYTRLLEGDIFGAWARFDVESQRSLQTALQLICWHFPVGSYGSPNRVSDWRKSKDGIRASAKNQIDFAVSKIQSCVVFEPPKTMKDEQEFVTIVVLNDGETYTDISGCTIQTISTSDYYKVTSDGGDAKDFTPTCVIRLGEFTAEYITTKEEIKKVSGAL